MPTHAQTAEVENAPPTTPRTSPLERVNAPPESRAVDIAPRVPHILELSLGVFVALFASLLLFSRSGTALLQFPDRSIGAGLFEGVDASRRAAIYVQILAVAISVTLGFHYGGRRLRLLRPRWFVGVRARMENDLCATLGGVGIVAIVARVSADRLDGLAAVYLVTCALFAVSCLSLVRRLAPPGPRGRLLRHLAAWTVSAPFLLLPWPSVQLCALLRQTWTSALPRASVLDAAVLPLVYAAFAWAILRYGRQDSARVRRALPVAAAPFFLLPALCPFANELEYVLSAKHELSPLHMTLALCGALALTSAIGFHAALRGRLRVQPRALLEYYALPATIFGVAAIAYHQQHLPARWVDPLHDGEQITSVHQLLRFGKLPFIDVWPAHGLYDYVGAVFAALNELAPLDLPIWNFVLAALSVLASYLILAKVSHPVFAFLVALALPLEVLFPLPVYSFFCAEPPLLFTVLIACWTMKRPSVWRHGALALVASMCFFWTPASGVATILAILGVLLAECLTSRAPLEARRGLLAFAGTGLLVLLAYVLTLIAFQKPVGETLQLVVAYIKADPMVAGRGFVVERFDAMAFFQYVALPAVGAFYVVRLACRAIERRPLTGAERVLSLLALISLVMFMRTLTRHSLFERYQPFFFPFLAGAVFFPGAVASRTRHAQSTPVAAKPSGISGSPACLAQAAFCAMFALYLVPFATGAQPRVGLDPFVFRDWHDQPRRNASPLPVYPELRAFLASTLGPNDTFLELVNMPLLYTLFGRELPGQFFFVSMFYATDGVQDKFLRRFDEFGGVNRVPVVLLGSVHGEAHVDGIANTLRSYRIAERIYRDYVPFQSIDGFDVWVSRQRWADAARRVSPVPLELGDAKDHQAVALGDLRIDGDVLAMTALGKDARLDRAVRIDGIKLGGLSSAHATSFQYRSDRAGALTMSYAYSGREYDAASSGSAALVPSQAGEWLSASVPIPPRPIVGESLSGVRIAPPEGAHVELRRLQLDFGAPPTRGPESQSLGMLPFVWGNFDRKDKASDATIVQSLPLPHLAGSPRAIELAVAESPDPASAGYLRLCIRVPGSVTRRKEPASWRTVRHEATWRRAGTATVSYGTDPVSKFDFDLVAPNLEAPDLPAGLAESFETTCKPYLIRTSAQYNWTNRPVRRIQIDSSLRIVLDEASLLAPD